MSSKVAVVSGGGPVGMFSAALLGSRGYDVHVYERLPRKEVHARERGRLKYSMVLNWRAMNSLAVIPGLDDAVRAAGVIKVGGVAHNPNGTFTLVPRPLGPIGTTVSIDRDDLAASIRDFAVEKFGIECHFGNEVEGVDFENKVITVRDMKSGREGDREYSILVSAEGIRSRIRDKASAEGRVKVKKNPNKRHFKTVNLGKVGGLFKAPEPGSPAADPTRTRYMIAPNKRVSMVLPATIEQNVHGAIIFESVDECKDAVDHESTSKCFQTWFPQVFGPEGPSREFTDDFLSKKLRMGSVSVFCDRYDIAGSCVLIGDAGHACWPTLGQSGVAGLESVAVLADTVFDVNGSKPLSADDLSDKDIARRLRKYSVKRRPDAHSVCTMSEIRYVFRGQRYQKVMSRLHKIFGMKRGTIRAMGDPNEKYRVVHMRHTREAVILRGYQLFTKAASLACVLKIATMGVAALSSKRED